VRIAVVEFAGRGGLVQYAFQLCRALAAAGADVTLITSTDYELDALEHPFRLDKRLRLWDPKPAGTPRTSRWRRVSRAFRHYREWARLVLHLARTRPDVVQLGDLRFPTDLLPVLALRAAGLTVAEVCHNVDPFTGGRRGGMPRRSRAWTLAFGALYRSCAVVFAHFESGRRALLSRYRLREERVAAIPHGDESLFAELREPGYGPGEVRAELGCGASSPIVLLMGTLTAYKGVDLLLRAFALVRAEMPEARLAVAGFPASDFDLAAARALVGELGLDESVRIVARYVEAPRVAAWLEAAAVGAFPYRAVWQSGAVLLAQTFGLPVVATRVGGMAEEVEDGRTGLLVPPGDERAVAGAIVRLLRDPRLARAMGERAAASVRERFAWPLVARAILERYEALPAPARARAAPQRARW
jgi:glycosyltransferase involved in cell wall biosynthesis